MQKTPYAPLKESPLYVTAPPTYTPNSADARHGENAGYPGYGSVAEPRYRDEPERPRSSVMPFCCAIL